MTNPPDDNLDHYALGYYAPGKGLRREDRRVRCGGEGERRRVMGFLRFLRLWTVLSVPAGIVIGKLLKANRKATTRPVDRS
jgi:hypothetical protein